MTGLDNPAKKEIAMQIVSSNENSSLNWRDQYKYIEDIHDGRGYTGGIVGFCSGTGDMLDLVKYFKSLEPGNILAQYIPALERVNGTDSHDGLDPNFVPDWQAAAADPLFQRAQDDERDRVYFNPAVSQGKSDGVGALGQFIYYDAFVMHGSGDDPDSFGSIRATAMEHADTPAQGGDEVTYLNAFLDARREVMGNEPDHVGNIDRIDTEQRVWVQQPNLNLDTPLSWTVNDQPFHINGNGGNGR